MNDHPKGALLFMWVNVTLLPVMSTNLAGARGLPSRAVPIRITYGSSLAHLVATPAPGFRAW